MRKFRLLTEKEIECRISEIAKNGSFVKILLYKTARTDAALLDEIYGEDRWQNEYKMLDGRLYCGIGIKSDCGEWIWKWNVGTESNMEAEKGQASDAMKRAGFVIGIGTELYSAPEIKVYSDSCNIKEYNGKYKCYDKFDVEKIKYDDNQDISAISIRCNGKRCFVWSQEKGIIKA